MFCGFCMFALFVQADCQIIMCLCKTCICLYCLCKMLCSLLPMSFMAVVKMFYTLHIVSACLSLCAFWTFQRTCNRTRIFCAWVFFPCNRISYKTRRQNQ